MKFKIVLFTLFVSFLLPFVHSTSFAVTNEVDKKRNERERKRERRPRLEQHDAATYREKMRSEQEWERERKSELQDDTAATAETSESVDEQSMNSSAVEVKEITGIELTAEGSAVEVKEVTGIELTAEGSGT